MRLDRLARSSGKPGRDCPRCPRLVAFRTTWREKEPDWFNAPVASFGPIDARLLIVGLAPGLRGANRTGRPFTGDYAGDLLYATLKGFGFAHGTYDARPDDGFTLSIAASPMRFAACRPRTSRRRKKSPPVAAFSARRSRKCRSFAPSSRSAASRTRRGEGPLRAARRSSVRPWRRAGDGRDHSVR